MGAEELASLVKKLRDGRGLTQGQLADFAGVKRSWLSHVESASRKKPDWDMLERLEVFFRLEYGLLAKTAGYNISQRPRPPRQRTPQELIRELDAITPLLVPETDQPASAGFGIEPTPEHWPYMPEHGDRSHRFIAVPIRGTCMEPRLKEGERAIVDTDASPRSGDIVLAIHEGEAIIKILEKRDGDNYLVALQGRPPLRINDTTKVLGVVKMAMHRP